ncbi:FAD-dependent oxidoreductase [Cohnella cellulosilytica]|uniref:FAD-dependent oxidoreductase n=1 Tax=Cohnella cellulosilytica TaxID=986710 RepID=A0ABW2F158_9BACL
MNNRMPAAQLPVLFDADVVVVGGSFAGLACAAELAKRGDRVAVIEPRTYLGREATATLRPWLELPEGADPARLPLPVRRALQAEPSATSASAERRYAPLHPDRLKRSLEDLLEEHGVELLYASLPVAVLQTAGQAAGLIVANKSGRQAIRCRRIVDATETALLAILCGEEMSGEASATGSSVYRRTLEFTGVDVDADEFVEAPEAGRVRLRGGYLGEGHILAEFGLVLNDGNHADADREREIAARHIGMRLAAYLINHVPAFRQATFTAASHELLGPFSLEFESGDDDRLAAEGEISSVGRALDLNDISVPVAGVYCLGKRLLRFGDTALLDPVQASVLGEKLAYELAGSSARSMGEDSLSESALQEASGSSSDGSAFVQAVEGVRDESAYLRGVEGVRDESAYLRGVEGSRDESAYLRGVEGSRDESTNETSRAAIVVPSLIGTDGSMETVEIDEQVVSMRKRADVLVVGGGSSGASASITAAREGMRTIVLDLNPGLGGTGTFGGVDSYWFGKRGGYAAKITEDVTAVQREIRYKGHKWNIEAKMYALLKAAVEAGVEPLFNAITFGVVQNGSRVGGAVAATRWGPCVVEARVAIDATGDGDLAAMAGAEFVYGSEKDHTVMWYSLAQFRTPGKLQNNFTSMVDVSNVLDYTRAIVAGRRRGEECHDHGIYIATRESRHIIGDAVMKLTDQLLHRRWPDVVNIHFSNHDVKGVSGAEWVNVGLIPPNLEIEIPYRMLLPKGLEGILVVGKAVSATHDALPAIRMQSDLENLGAAAALAAALAVREDTTPRSVSVRSLQQRLAREGLIPEAALTRELTTHPYSDEELRKLVESIETEQPLYEYSNMRMNEVYRSAMPFVEICSIGPRIVPFVEQALERADGVRKTRLAQALAMLGSPSGVPALVEAILADLGGEELPVRTADIMYVQLPPDHGAMPDTANLLYSLAQTADPRAIPVWQRVADLLHPDEEDFRDTWKGIFYYVDAVCRGAERLGDRRAIPPLERMHAVPLFRSQHCAAGAQADYFPERRAMLELAIGRALARCGGREGYEILIRYLDDARSLLSRNALLELQRLSGRTDGKDARRWREWLEQAKPYETTHPLRMRLDVERSSESLLRQFG